MEKLKSLKDIESFDALNPTFVSRTGLRREGIKWILDCDSVSCVQHRVSCTKCIWIKYFFNIEEEELKGGK